MTVTCRIAARLAASTTARLEALVSGTRDEADDADSVLALVKSDPGNVSLVHASRSSGRLGGADAYLLDTSGRSK